MSKNKEIYNNFKGADWFAPDTEVLLLGLGSIGSWVGINLARQGYNIYAFDDDSYEPHNAGSQLVNAKSMGKRKDEVFKEFAFDYGNNTNIELLGRYVEDSPTGNIVISAFDNMAARKLAYTKWKDNQVSKTKEYRLANPDEINLFIDGRLTIETGIIFCLDSMQDCKDYEKTLFDDSEIETEPCSYRQSTHSAMIMGGYITGLLLNQIANKKLGVPVRAVPFSTQFELFTYSLSCRN